MGGLDLMRSWARSRCIWISSTCFSSSCVSWAVAGTKGAPRLSALRASMPFLRNPRGSALRARPWLPSGRAFGATFAHRGWPRLRRYLRAPWLAAPSALPSRTVAGRAFGATPIHQVSFSSLPRSGVLALRREAAFLHQRVDLWIAAAEGAIGVRRIDRVADRKDELAQPLGHRAIVRTFPFGERAERVSRDHVR